jgi:hypothetical protein
MLAIMTQEWYNNFFLVNIGSRESERNTAVDRGEEASSTIIPTTHGTSFVVSPSV